MAAQRRRPTQMDIARRVDLSQATVSLVISGGAASAQVSEETRRAVLGAAAEVGYTVNAAARSLKGGRNRMLGLYTFEPVFPVDQRDFYFPFLLGVEEATAERGYDLLLFSSTSTDGARRIYAGGVNRLKVADGCVLLGRHMHRDDLINLVSEDFPFVFIGRREVPGRELSYVAPDYVGATRRIIGDLADRGHRRIAYLKLDDDQEPTRDRETGFWQEIHQVGIPEDDVVVHPMKSSDPLDPAVLIRWSESGITALVVEPSEDATMINTVEHAAQSAGIGIPGDCSMVVLGDPSMGGAGSRDWTRFSLPREQMGREAVQLLLQLLDDDEGQPPRQLFVDCIPIDGDSLAEPGHGGAAS